MSTGGPQTTPAGEVSVLTYAALRDSRGGGAGLCERLPAAPAVYAWFRTIRVPANRGPEAFVQSILDAIEAPAAPNWRAKLGPMHTNTLESRSELSPSKRTLLDTLALNEGFRQYTARIVEAAAILQAPLYVGKAQDLQRRTRQHLDPMSDLSVRLREAGSSRSRTPSVQERTLRWRALYRGLVLRQSSRLIAVFAQSPALSNFGETGCGGVQDQNTSPVLLPSCLPTIWCRARSRAPPPHRLGFSGDGLGSS